MTRVIGFDRSFKITVPISLVVIVAGLIGVLVLGFNNGVDFQAGLNTNVQFAPPSMAVSFSGEGTMRLTVSKSAVDLISQAPSGASKAYTFAYDKYRTLQALADGVGAVQGMRVELKAPGNLDSSLLLGASQTESMLTTAPAVLHYRSAQGIGKDVGIESVRASLKDFGSVSIQRVGEAQNLEYMIRVQDPGKDPTFSKTIGSKVKASLGASFGADNVIVNRTDFVGARFSENLARQAAWLTLLTFLLIYIYCAFRFKPIYAIGAVLSVVHDALVMVAFIVFTRMEFNTSVIAAILTIVGYSINDTIVIYDRIREKVKLNPNAPFRENMNRGVTETLSRTFITAGTVLLSAVALFIFTTGSMKDFSLCIIVGVTTGTYSSVFIASAFVDMWKVLEAKAEKKKALKAQAAPAAAKSSPAAAKGPAQGGKAGK